MQERAILPKHYTRVPSIARTSASSTSFAQDCASNTTLLTNVSAFNSQVALLAGSKPVIDDVDQAQQQQQQQQHYYAENLRNNHLRAQIYEPLRKDRGELEYKQLAPLLLRKDEVGSDDTRILMESQDFKKPEAVARMGVPQFEKEKARGAFYWTQVGALV